VFPIGTNLKPLTKLAVAACTGLLPACDPSQTTGPGSTAQTPPPAQDAVVIDRDIATDPAAIPTTALPESAIPVPRKSEEASERSSSTAPGTLGINWKTDL
jgi:hypothetical protein